MPERVKVQVERWRVMYRFAAARVVIVRGSGRAGKAGVVRRGSAAGGRVKFCGAKGDVA